VRALVVENGRIGLREVPFRPMAGDVTIRVRAAGICGTDLQILQGYARFTGIPGHEFVGVVEAVSSPDGAPWLGKRVVGEINVGCGRCGFCGAGVKEHCTDRTVVGIRGRDGAFAELLSLPPSNLHEVPDAVDDRAAVFVEPVAAACRIFEQIEVDGRRAAVVGDGRMGLLVAQVLRTRTPGVTVFGRHDPKLAIARQLGLATHNPAAPDPPHAYDVVVDVTGRTDGLRRALALARPRGVVVLKSTFHGEAALETWPIVVDEVSLIGSRCGPFRPALDLLASGQVAVGPLVSRVAALEEHEAALAQARRDLKVIFRLPGANLLDV
jgi:threonine dehydrogenase-like Zn-dependent dehydrogenase